ncbi:hypothetical protein H4582DRAFT_2086925 [Lactarius indigo]|nr:hypothetical protein H4582DRAFT_2086925 [Lactarius indigo]
MTGQELVFCICCNKHLPRKHEREHHRRANKLLMTPTPRKRPRLAFKAAHTPRDKPKLKAKPPECQDMHTSATGPNPDVLFQDVEIPWPSTSNGEGNCDLEDSGQGHMDRLLASEPEDPEDSSEVGHDMDADGDGEPPLEEGPDGDESDIVDTLDQEGGLAGIIGDELGEDFKSNSMTVIAQSVERSLSRFLRTRQTLPGKKHVTRFKLHLHSLGHSNSVLVSPS